MCLKRLVPVIPSSLFVAPVEFLTHCLPNLYSCTPPPPPPGPAAAPIAGFLTSPRNFHCVTVFSSRPPPPPNPNPSLFFFFFFFHGRRSIIHKRIYLPCNMENSYSYLCFSGLTLINVICTAAPSAAPLYESCAIKFQSSL